MGKDLERLLTYCPATDKKADQMLNQGNKLVGYIFQNGEIYRTCAFGSVRNSISQKEWEGLTFPSKPSYEQLEKELAELKEANRWRSVEDELPELDTHVLIEWFQYSRKYPNGKKSMVCEAYLLETERGKEWFSSEDLERDAIRWMPMPLPELPAVEEGI